MLKLTVLSTQHDALLRKLTFEDAAVSAGELPPETLRCLSGLARLAEVPAVRVMQLLGSPTPAAQPQVCSLYFVRADLMCGMHFWSCVGEFRCSSAPLGVGELVAEFGDSWVTSDQVRPGAMCGRGRQDVLDSGCSAVRHNQQTMNYSE